MSHQNIVASIILHWHEIDMKLTYDISYDTDRLTMTPDDTYRLTYDMTLAVDTLCVNMALLTDRLSVDHWVTAIDDLRYTCRNPQLYATRGDILNTAPMLAQRHRRWASIGAMLLSQL